MNTVTKILAYFRMLFFNSLIQWEIFQRIFPHMCKEKDWGYRFHSEEELLEKIRQDRLEVLSCLEAIDNQAEHMGKAYGQAFRHIMYRDLSSRMFSYMNIAQYRVPRRHQIDKYT